MCDREFPNQPVVPRGGRLPDRSAIGVKRMLGASNYLESFANPVSDYEGFQTMVLRYGLLDGRSGSFFSSFRPHVRATLRLTA